MSEYTQRHFSATQPDHSADATPFDGRNLVVVSNRQPYRHEPGDDGGIKVQEPTGGLTASLDPMMQRTGGTWVAWGDGQHDRSVVDETNTVEMPPSDPSYSLRRVWLTHKQERDYYYGFSNQVLWPLCHSALATVDSKRQFWQAYKRTNAQFGAVVADEADAEDVIWFHDYHLALAPRDVREEVGTDPLCMQFWHIPWPVAEIFESCPHRQDLLEGLLANDVIGFHVHRYRKNFLESVDRILPHARVDYERSLVTYDGLTTDVVAVPMGVPVTDIQKRAIQSHTTANERLQQSFVTGEQTALAVGVDRLDYSKGIVERLRALEALWESDPRWRESLTYVQNASPSRSEIPAYQRVQRRVKETTESLNNRFGTPDWQPVVWITDHLSKAELYDLYRQADIGIVSSVRDGLNLVAEEFVASQVSDDGVLVLSEHAGADELLGDAAISVSPFDVEQFADALREALTLAPRDRQVRMRQLRRTVADHDLDTWLETHAVLAENKIAAKADTIVRDSA